MKKCFLSLLLACSIVTVACAGENTTSKSNDSTVVVQKPVQVVQTQDSVIDAKQSQIKHIKVPAKNIASPMDVNVILPKSYATSTDKKYPVVYILHGYDGDYKTWLTLTEPKLDSLASHYDMIFVLPDGRDSWYWDAPADPKLKMESFFVKELVPYIDKNYRTIADKDYRAITGLSMGGHGSLWLGMRHSDIWGSAGSMSGGVNINKPKWAKSWKMAQRLGSQAQYPDRWKNHTVITLVKSLKPGQLNIIFDCGVDDFFIGVNRELHEEMLKYKIPHDYSERPGKHSHSYWKNSIRYHLQYFHDIFNK